MLSTNTGVHIPSKLSLTLCVLVLFLRHKLQKGFLQRDQAPKEEEMDLMAKYMAELQSYGEIEVGIIRQTKIQKVLKAIMKLPSIPKEEEYNFKSHALEILTGWKNVLDTDIPTPGPAYQAAKESEVAPAAEESKAEESESKPKESESREAEDQTMTDAGAEKSPEKTEPSRKSSQEMTTEAASEKVAEDSAGKAENESSA